MRPPVNLASRPFRNRNLPRLLVGLAWAGLLALTAKHALSVRRLLPSRTTALHREVGELEAVVRQKQADVRRLRVEKVDAPTLKRWALLKDLVDRRVLSWTRLFAVLEAVLPPDARLVSIAPDSKEDAFRLTMRAVVRNTEASLTLVRALEERPEFEDVLPESWTRSDRGEEVHYRMVYHPERASSAPPTPVEGEVPAAAASPEAGER